MEKYRIEVDHCRDINGLIVEKEELIPDVCNWSAELDDYYYRMKDSLLTYDKDKMENNNERCIGKSKIRW